MTKTLHEHKHEKHEQHEQHEQETRATRTTRPTNTTNTDNTDKTRRNTNKHKHLFLFFSKVEIRWGIELFIKILFGLISLFLSIKNILRPRFKLLRGDQRRLGNARHKKISGCFKPRIKRMVEE